MKIRLLFLSLLLLSPRPVAAQTRQELAATCVTLGHLTKKSMDQNDRIRVVLYVQTADVIRSALGDPQACQADFFTRVVQSNLSAFANVRAVVTLNSLQLGPGWMHVPDPNMCRRPTEGVTGVHNGMDERQEMRVDTPAVRLRQQGTVRPPE